MVFKLHFAGRLKKFPQKARVPSLEELQAVAGRLAGVEPKLVELLFTDSEGDLIKIVDLADFEYFFANSDPEAGIFPIIDVRLLEANAPEETPAETDALQEIQQRVLSLSESLLETKNSIDAMKKTPKEVPQETPQEVPQEVPQETPRETPQETPHETPQETPQETPRETPQETPQEVPQEPKPERRARPQFRRHRRVQPEAAEPIGTIHTDVICDWCRVGPIVGNRFKCMICPDFDLCGTCDAKAAHGHPMLRLTQESSHSFLDRLQFHFARESERGGRRCGEHVGRRPDGREHFDRRARESSREIIRQEDRWREELREKRKRNLCRKEERREELRECRREERKECRREGRREERRESRREERRAHKANSKNLQPCHKLSPRHSEMPSGCHREEEPRHSPMRENFETRRHPGFERIAPELGGLFQVLSLLMRQNRC